MQAPHEDETAADVVESSDAPDGGGSGEVTDEGEAVEQEVESPGETEVAVAAASDDDEEDGRSPALDPEAVRLLAHIVESVLFAAAKPMGVRDLLAILKAGGGAEASAKEVRAALQRLLEDFGPGRRGIVLCEVDGGYQFRTARENAEWVRQVFKEKPTRLGRATLETLAIVAYRQPVTKAEIEAIRGVDADAALGTLLARRLVKIAGRKEAIGRPLLYATAPEFLEVFGLKNLNELPALDELAAVTLEEDDDEPETAEGPEDDGAPAGSPGGRDAETEVDGRDAEAEGDGAAPGTFARGGGDPRDGAPAAAAVDAVLGEAGDAGEITEGGEEALPAAAGDDVPRPDGAEPAPAGRRQAADANGGEAAEDPQPSRDRVAAGGGGPGARGSGQSEREGGDGAGDEGEPGDRPHSD